MNRSYRIALILIFTFSIFFKLSTVNAQSNTNVDAVKDLLKYFLQPANGGVADCDSRYKDENGKCLTPEQLLNKCSAIGKIDKNGNYNPACCLTNEQCQANGPLQTCDIPNDFCNSGSSCNDHGQPVPTSDLRDVNPERSLDNFPYYCQGDNRWRYEGGLDQAGCGPTSMSMVLRYFGYNESPPSVNRVFLNNGWRASIYAGSAMQPLLLGTIQQSQAWLEQYHLKVGPNLVGANGFNIDSAKTHLSQGALIIASSQNFRCGGGCTADYTGKKIDHIFVIDKIDDRGRVRVRDPSNCIWPANAPYQGTEVWADYHLYRFPNEVNYYAYPVKKQ